MPPKWAESAVDPAWVRGTADYLETLGEAFPRGQVLGEEAHSHVMQGLGVRDGQASLSQVRASALYTYRTGGEGLTATGFEPSRHTVMLRGRPAQVLG